MECDEVYFKSDNGCEYIFDKTDNGWLTIIYIRGPIETNEDKLINARIIEILPECLPLFKEILFTDKEIAVAECRRDSRTPPEFRTVDLKEDIYNIRKESDGSMIIYCINDLIPPYSAKREVIGKTMPLHIQHVLIDKGALDKLREFVKNYF